MMIHDRLSDIQPRVSWMSAFGQKQTLADIGKINLSKLNEKGGGRLNYGGDLPFFYKP